MAEHKSCPSCAYYVVMPQIGPAKTIQGMCHRNPPIPVPLGIQNGQVVTSTCWPIVDKAHWCGEYKPKLLDS